MRRSTGPRESAPRETGGATVVTRDGEDFGLIRRFKTFGLEIVREATP